MEEAGEWELDESLKEAVKYAGDKTFYLRDDGYYVDSEYDEEDYDDPIHIDYLSDEYFDLLLDEPDLSDYFAVSDSLIVIWNDVVYQIDPVE